MNIKFKILTLQCRKSREVIDFSPQVSFFHGQISAGKSSIARLIDFCLGGDLEMTPAITQELVAVELSAHIGIYEVLFEREAQGSNQVRVSWRNDSGEMGSVLAPIQSPPNAKPIWGDAVFNLSDLIFYLLEVTPIKVRRGKREKDSPLVRLSFRDVMWYCYLDQNHLDSSFYRLEDTFRRLKSRDVMRFVVGFYTEKLNDLEILLEDTREQRLGKLEAAKEVSTFLKQFDYGSESDIRNEITRVKKQLLDAQSEKMEMRKGHATNTHFADKLRARLRDLSGRLASEEQSLADLNERITEQEALKAELMSAKFRLARTESTLTVLSGVSFEFCPACGAKLDTDSQHEEGTCQLCKKAPSTLQNQFVPQSEVVRRDLTSRIDELAESIERHTNARKRQGRIIDNLRKEKAILDRQLTEELENYDSAFLAQSRNVDRIIATLEERVRNLEKIIKMPEAISKLEEEADMLRADEEGLRRKIQSEKEKFINANQYIQNIEATFLQSLLEVGVPGVEHVDQISLNRNSWIPSILTSGDKALGWDFYNAGSGGKKTLLNVCYALAVHKIAAEDKLPLPTFLIIDTPMKNIGEDVNRDLFVAFYKYLYDLAEGSLSDTQFIIIDKEYIAPDSEKINIIERYMTPKKGEFPPLISYYEGP